MASATDKPKKRTKTHSCLKGLGCFTVSIGILGILAFVVFCGVYFFRASRFDMDQVSVMPQRTVVLDRNGKELGRLHGENRTVVSFNNISPFFLMSIIAREDARFYEHKGVDLRGLARATVRNIKDRNMTQGASTITMQLARNTFDLSQGNEWYHELDRKILEIFVTFLIERKYDKTEILSHYSNRIFWGHSMLGIEAASQAYLQKPAKNLSLSEGAMLAGIVRGPNAFSPFRSIKLATRERDTVLDRLVYYSYITPEEAAAAKAEPLNISPRTTRTKGQSYAMDAIGRELTSYLSKNNFKVGGLTIHTTIDKELQNIAENSVNNRLLNIENLSGYRHQTRYEYQKGNSKKAPAYLQGALVCIDNKTGGIVATVGGRSANESRFNRAYYARRQVGSLFKPFVFQAAFDRGLRPGTLIDDSALKPGEIDHANDKWNPGNSDGQFRGLVKTRDALLKSRNTSSVRVGDFATMPHVQRAAEVAGFELFQRQQRQSGKMPNSATAYLGSWEASPQEVARAYSIFPNNGKYIHPIIITKIIASNGETLFHSPRGIEVVDEPLSSGSTLEVTKILEEINISGTGRTVRSTYGFTSPSAGKTGTTDDYKDAWYAGYTSSLTCAVWVGLDTPKRTISKGYGSRLALPIWADVMKAASRKPEFKPQELGKAIQTTQLQMCNRSARRANDYCVAYKTAYNDEIPNDLYGLLNRPCTIHVNPNEKAVVQNTTRPEPVQQLPKERSNAPIGSFLDRLLGKKNKPARAIVVEEDSTYQTYPDPSPEAKPVRAIVVEEAPPRAPTQRPILVRPLRDPNRAERARVANQSYRPQRQAPRRAPQRAIIVEEPRRQQPPPQRAIIVEEPAARPVPPRAIVVEDPAFPTTRRAIIVD